MPGLENYLEKVDFQDQNFVGTIAFRSEEYTLPDGSKMALGIDDGHWVMVYQDKPSAHFMIFECDWKQKKILLDKKPGGEKEFGLFRKLLGYFISHAQVDDLVTILPPTG